MYITAKTVFTITALSTLLPGTLIRAQDASAPAQPTVEQTQPLQGSWEGVEVGREAEGKCTMTVTGNSIDFRGLNKAEWYKATLTMPAGTDPKQLRAAITDCPQPHYIGKVAFSIFKVEDGTLTLVGHAPGAPDAPKTFDGDKTSRSFVFKKAPFQKENTKPSKSE